MEPDAMRIAYQEKEKQRQKNVKEYQRKFFNKITKGKYKGK